MSFELTPRERRWLDIVLILAAVALTFVVLGFLAGLWLAPLVESNLMAVFSLLLLLPLGILALALLWHLLPERFTRTLGQGWNAALLVLPLAGLVAFAFSVCA